MTVKKIILDSNFLLIPFKFKVDIFSEISYLLEGEKIFIISKGILNELNKLSKNKGKEGMSAKFALQMVEKNKDRIKIIASEKRVDDWILDYSKKYNSIVCTNDTKLINDLKKERIKVVVLKKKSRIDFA